MGQALEKILTHLDAKGAAPEAFRRMMVQILRARPGAGDFSGRDRPGVGSLLSRARQRRERQWPACQIVHSGLIFTIGEGEWLDSQCGMTQDFAAVAGRRSLPYPWMIR